MKTRLRMTWTYRWMDVEGLRCFLNLSSSVSVKQSRLFAGVKAMWPTIVFVECSTIQESGLLPYNSYVLILLRFLSIYTILLGSSPILIRVQGFYADVSAG